MHIAWTNLDGSIQVQLYHGISQHSNWGRRGHVPIHVRMHVCMYVLCFETIALHLHNCKYMRTDYSLSHTQRSLEFGNAGSFFWHRSPMF